MLEDGGSLAFPPVLWGDHLVAALFDVGPAISSGFGLSPLTYAELESWANLSSFPLEPWEAEMLRALSRVYVAALREGEDPACPAPYTTLPDAAERESIGRKIMEALNSRKSTPPRGERE